MTSLVSLPDIQAELEAQSVTRIDISVAYTVLQKMYDAYETDRTASADKMAELQKTVDSLQTQDTSLQEQIATLTTKLAVATADVHMAVGSTPILTSRFETALSHVDGQDLMWANKTAKLTGMASLAKAISIQQNHLLGWGRTDPWPWDGTGTRPPEPTAWGSLDGWLQMCLGIGNKLALNTQLYPWHLRGRWGADGVTIPCTVADVYSDDGVIMTNRTADYLLLIKRMAERYLVPPYNVRIWTTGTEFHGLYRGRDKTFKEWRWDDFPGTPGANADMGMAYIHNITVDQILAVAAAKSIDPATLTFINNYPPIVCNGKPISDSVPIGHPLRQRPWGTPNSQGFSILQHMIPLLKRVDIVGIDMGSINRDGVVLVADEFANLNRYDDILSYIKTIVLSKPIAIMETYDKPQVDPGPNSFALRAAIRADAFRHMLLNGIWAAFIWGTSGAAMGVYGDPGRKKDAALLTDTMTATGGQPTLMLDAVELYHDHFGPDTAIYDFTVIGTGVSALFSETKGMLINQTNATKTVAVDDVVYSLSPYQYMLIDR